MKTIKNYLEKALGIAGIVGMGFLNSCTDDNSKIIKGKVISEAEVRNANDKIIGSSYAIQSKEGIYVSVFFKNYSDKFNVGDSVVLRVEKGYRFQKETKLNDYELIIEDNCWYKIPKK